jgi:hypothetical protein
MLAAVFTLSALSYGVVVHTVSPVLLLASFVLFELCVGVYLPAMGMLKGKVVPEACRSMLYNTFRVPLNALVVLALLTDIPVRVGFAMTTGILLVCLLLVLQPAFGIAKAKKACVGRDVRDVDMESLGNRAWDRGGWAGMF